MTDLVIIAIRFYTIHNIWKNSAPKYKIWTSSTRKIKLILIFNVTMAKCYVYKKNYLLLGNILRYLEIGRGMSAVVYKYIKKQTIFKHTLHSWEYNCVPCKYIVTI